MSTKTENSSRFTGFFEGFRPPRCSVLELHLVLTGLRKAFASQVKGEGEEKVGAAMILPGVKSSTGETPPPEVGF